MPSSGEASLSRDQIREIDRRAVEEYGMPGAVLMENAGRGAAEVLLGMGIDGPVHIVCGPGNNGGDGFVIARYLDLQRIPVVVHLSGRPDAIRGDAGIHYRIIREAGLSISESVSPADLAAKLPGASWVVDAILGTGLSGPARTPYSELIACINAAGRRVLAVDLPSGMDADSSSAPGPGCCIRATATVTFVARKSGFSAAGAAAWTGPVTVVPIGIPRKLLAEYLRE